MQPRLDRFVQIFGNRIRFKEDLVIDLENRDLAMGRDFQEPIRLFAEIYVSNVEFNILSTQNNHGALDPRSSDRADQVIFGSH